MSGTTDLNVSMRVQQWLSQYVELMQTRGLAHYGEGVSQIEHMLQSAQLAVDQRLPETLIAAALLHDVGHLLGVEPENVAALGIDTQHERRGTRWLAEVFPPAVCVPIAMHVAAKRYRCSTDPDYYHTLSPASRQSLALQGGVMSDGQIAAFRHSPWYADAMTLRALDDHAKRGDVAPAELDTYLPLLQNIMLDHLQTQITRSSTPLNLPYEAPMSIAHTYTGPLQAIVFDWAGTTVDFGSRAPILAFMALFEANQVPITESEARTPMGLEKREHVAALLAMPRIAAAWQAQHGIPSTTADIDRLYHDFIPYQLQMIPRCATLLPGALDTFKAIRARGYQIGSNTGYARIMLDALLPAAAEQGYVPDATVTASDVSRGRPYPDMLWHNLMLLGTHHIASVVKVDDTGVGITEGLNAGCWTVGVAISGNEVGLSLAEWLALSADAQDQYRRIAYQKLNDAGAHYVIDSIADLMPILDLIEQRLSQGEKP
jgi:phosphonoacetaldehyde hydrolase